MAFFFPPQKISDPAQDKVHAGDRHGVTQRLVAGRVGSVWQFSPMVRKALKPFTFQWGQAADEPSSPDWVDRVEGTSGGTLLKRTAQIAILPAISAV